MFLDRPSSRFDEERTPLGYAQRAEDVRQLGEGVFDLLIVGGGITGAGAALDAAERGLRVAIVESEDFGSGASSKSSKLIHGGLRYLEMLDFGLVRQALAERRRLLHTIAPHLVRPVRFIWPLTHRVWERAYLTAGLTLYDTMAGRGAVTPHRQLTRKKLRRTAPGLDVANQVGGISFSDATEDDARMVIAVLRTARGYGATVLSGARAGATISHRGGVREVAVEIAGEGEVRVRARHVSYATGALTDQQDTASPLRVRPSKGVHILVPRDRIRSNLGVLTRTEKSVLFIIPWLDRWLIGDTDTDWPHKRETPIVCGADVEYLLEKANRVLVEPLTSADVVGAFAGLRPLIQQGDAADTTKLSREHVVVSPEPGVTMIAGGKYTTYRLMAADLVDAAAEQLGGRISASGTSTLPLLGAQHSAEYSRRRDDICAKMQFSPGTVDHLLGRYGSDIDVLLAEALRHDLLTAVEGYEPYLWAELRYAFSHEGARSVADALERRTRIGIQFRDGGCSIAERVADLGAEVLGWNVNERKRQIVQYLRVREAEAAALREGDEVAALAAYRAVMGEVRPLSDPVAPSG